jgi:nitronate monooxygenase
MLVGSLASLMTVPVVGAPLAGGPSTPALVSAVCEGGGLGFIAAGYRSVADVAREIAEVRVATQRPFGVNIFFPTRLDADEEAVNAFAASLAAESERYGVALGEPCWSDDEWEGKLELVARERPAVVSFTFGCPAPEVISWLQGCGIGVWCTVTTPGEAQTAAAAGVDALIVQGGEAGGHQSSFDDADVTPIGLLSLLPLVRRVTGLPLIGAGGIAGGAGVAAALAAGASAAQVGSALMLTPEAGTSEAHRAAFATDAPTALTRAFTGRRARGIVNRFMHDYDAAAPKGYPQVHYLTAPLRAAARAAGDAGGINLWAGEAYRLSEVAPAAELVERWGAEARAAR